MGFRRLFCGVVLFLVLFLTKPVLAQTNNETSFEAKIDKILEEKQIDIEGQKQLYQKIELKALTGVEKDKVITVENGKEALANVTKYEVGQRVIVTKDDSPDGSEFYSITDFCKKR